MVGMSVASRPRRLGAYLRFSLVLILSLVAWPVAAQDREQDENRTAAEKTFAEGARLWNEGTAPAKLRAIEKYLEALDLWRASGARSEEAQALSRIGNAYNNLGDYRKAIAYWEQALPLSRAMEDRRNEIALMANIGVAYARLDENKRALDYLAQAAPMARAAGELRTEARALDWIANIYNSSGDKQKALEPLRQALQIWRKLNDPVGEANILHAMGSVYDDFGEKQKAIESLSQSLSLRRKQGDKNAIASALYALGLVYDSIYDRQKAVECFKEGLELRKAVGHPKGEGVALNSLGNFYEGLGDKRQAIDHYTRALTILEAQKNYSTLGSVLRNLGLTLESIGERRKALEYFKRAAALAAFGGARRIQGRLLADMGKLLCEMEEYEQALEHLNSALTITRASGERFWEIHTLHWMARAERGRGDLQAARARIAEAIGKIESLRPTVNSPELRASAFSRAQEIYEFEIDTLMQLHRLRPAENYAAEALRANEQARAREMLAMLAEARAEIRQGVEPDLLARERSLRERLDSQANRLTFLLGGKSEDAQVEAARRELDALQTEYQQAQTQIRRTSPRYAALTEPRPLSLAEIQRQVLDADTLLLEYSLGEKRSYLWAVTIDSMNSYELPGRAEIERTSRRVYDLLTARNRQIRFETADEKKERVAQADAEYLIAATALARIALGPITGRLNKKRLLIVSDGALQYIPFAALPSPHRSHVSYGLYPLIADHEIVTLPSASTLAVLRHELEERTPAPKSVAVLADPVFNRNDERFKAAPVSSSAASFDTEGETESDLVRSARDIGVDGFHLARLPFTRREAQSILALAPKHDRLAALDFAASQFTIFEPALSQYRYVHIATHGLLNSLRPELSGIVLSLIDERGVEQDGFLRAHEVFALRLPAEMVVLSGCQTGLGGEIKGEGLVGLTRGFMYAGAARVMVSLWEVNDQVTSHLMARLYQGLLGKRRLSPAAALREAQISLWRDKRWGSPYYWAAFALQGEPR